MGLGAASSCGSLGLAVLATGCESMPLSISQLKTHSEMPLEPSHPDLHVILLVDRVVNNVIPKVVLPLLKKQDHCQQHVVHILPVSCLSLVRKAGTDGCACSIPGHSTTS